MGGQESPRLEAPWRVRAYVLVERLMAVAGGITCVSAVALLPARSTAAEVVLWCAVGVMAALPALGRVRVGLRLGLLGAACTVSSMAGAVALGLTPGVVLGPATAATLAGMFGSRRGALLQALAGALALVTVGAAFAWGVLPPPSTAAIDPRVFANWLRPAITSAAIGGAIAFGAQHAFASAEDAHRSARRLLREREDAIRARDRAEDRALRLQRLATVEPIADGVARELNELFVVVLRWVDALRAPDGDGPRTRESLVAMRVAATRAADLARQLLFLGRPPEPTARPVVLDEAVAAALRLTAALLPPSITVASRLGSPGTVALAPGQMEQALVNLALNARDAMPGGGTWTVETGTEPDLRLPHFVRVGDSGSGMDEATRRRAFDAFFTTKGDGHAGLGLTATRRIVEAAGGRVDVESAIDAGTRVTLRFPDGARAETSPGDALSRGPGAGAAMSTSGAQSAEEGLAQRAAVFVVVERVIAATAALQIPGQVVPTPSFSAAARDCIIASLAILASLPFLRAITHRSKVKALCLSLAALHFSICVVGGNIAPVNILLPFAAVTFAAVFLGPAWSTGLLALTVATTVAGGVVVTSGRVLGQGQSLLDPLHMTNWARVAAAMTGLGLVCALTAHAVIRVTEAAIEGAQRAIADLDAAEATRRRAQRVADRAQAQQPLAQVSAAIGHELNNLLVVVISWADLMDRVVVDDASRAEAIADVHRAAHHAGRLAGQLLALGKADDDLGAVVSLNDAVESSTRLLTRLVPGSVRVKTRLDAEGFVRMASGQMDQVLVNLALNARDAMPSGGTLTVETGRTTADGDDALFVRVTDTGHGMDEATRHRIFDPFFTTKGARGTGLGLAVVRQIVEGAGGTIAVESALGHGTTFTLRLPAAAPAVARSRRGDGCPTRC